jgi:hypothetical protein
MSADGGEADSNVAVRQLLLLTRSVIGRAILL